MTLMKHLNYIWISLMFFLIAPGIYLYSEIKGQDNASFVLILMIWIVMGLFYSVGFRLHFSYFLNDKRKRIIIDELNVTIKDRADSVSFRIDDIDSITNHHSGLSNRTPWNVYEFSVFKLKNGKEFTITCLLLDLQTIIDTFPNKILTKKNYYIATLNKNVKLLQPIIRSSSGRNDPA
ncbi:MAG: hypothetical protein Q8S18_07120 [Bacteroidales bacterium]|nr:hypothetical protein [Bacteroidales bacterium]